MRAPRANQPFVGPPLNMAAHERFERLRARWAEFKALWGVFELGAFDGHKWKNPAGSIREALQTAKSKVGCSADGPRFVTRTKRHELASVKQKNAAPVTGRREITNPRRKVARLGGTSNGVLTFSHVKSNP